MGRTWRIKQVKGPGGLVINYRYDTDGNLLEAARQGTDGISQPTDNSTWKYSYKPTGTALPGLQVKHLLIGATNPNDHETRYEYDLSRADAPARTVLQPEGVSNRFSYEYEAGRPVRATVKDGRLNDTVYHLDAQGYTTRMVAPRGATTEMTFNDEGLKTFERDPLGLNSTYTYDLRGNQTAQTMTGADGTTISSGATYDQRFSKPLSQTDANGNTTTYTLDSQGNVTRIGLPTGTERAMLYAANGDLQKITDERGLKTNLAYDDYGNPTSISRETTAGVFETTTNTYDIRSRLTATTDTREPSVTKVYDATGNVLASWVKDFSPRNSSSTNLTFKAAEYCFFMVFLGYLKKNTFSVQIPSGAIWKLDPQAKCQRLIASFLCCGRIMADCWR